MDSSNNVCLVPGGGYVVEQCWKGRLHACKQSRLLEWIKFFAVGIFYTFCSVPDTFCLLSASSTSIRKIVCCLAYGVLKVSNYALGPWTRVKFLADSTTSESSLTAPVTRHWALAALPCGWGSEVIQPTQVTQFHYIYFFTAGSVSGDMQLCISMLRRVFFS